MNMNSILFNLKEEYAASQHLASLKFRASASDEIGICTYVSGYFSYAEDLGGYRLYMSFWDKEMKGTRSAQAGHIEDEVQFAKACIGLINDVLTQYPAMDAVVLNAIVKE